MTPNKVLDHESNMLAKGKKGLIKLFPFPLIIMTLGIAIWVIINIIQKPYTGMVWLYKSGDIVSIDRTGPAGQGLQVGDRIVSIDDIPVYQARGLPNYKVGQEVVLTVDRGGNTFQYGLVLGRSPLSTILLQLSPVFVALSFWILGLFVFIRGKYSNITTFFLITCEVFSNILTLGTISAYGPAWCFMVFGFLLWWVGPFMIHLHLLLVNQSDNKATRFSLFFLYIFAGVFFSAPEI